jgi:hypothetical protein
MLPIWQRCSEKPKSSLTVRARGLLAGRAAGRVVGPAATVMRSPARPPLVNGSMARDPPEARGDLGRKQQVALRALRSAGATGRGAARRSGPRLVHGLYGTKQKRAPWSHRPPDRRKPAPGGSSSRAFRREGYSGNPYTIMGCAPRPGRAAGILGCRWPAGARSRQSCPCDSRGRSDVTHGLGELWAEPACSPVHAGTVNARLGE